MGPAAGSCRGQRWGRAEGLRGWGPLLALGVQEFDPRRGGQVAQGPRRT